MPESEIELKVDGLDALKTALTNAAVNIRTKVVRTGLRQAGRVIQQAAKLAVPVLATPTLRRNPGTIKSNIVVRNSKIARRAGDEGVFISVRPLRGAARQSRFGKAGANNPNDPYYWRFVEFGTKNMAGRRFMTGAADSKGQEAIRTFIQSTIAGIEKLDKV